MEPIALELSLRALEIGPGDEIIFLPLPLYEFITIASSIFMINVKPVFVDIEQKTYNIDLKD